MVAVRPAEESDLDAIAWALTRAFADDPLMGHILRTKHRDPGTQRFFVHEAKRALDKGAVYTTAGAGMRGGAIWSAPDKWRVTGLELLGEWPLLFAFGTAVPRALSVLNRMQKVHPDEPHWYLAILGTEPAHQGKGVGSALMAPVLERCDTEGIPAYLESSKEVNIPFYRRHGFNVTGEVVVPNGPTLWPMWRDPR
ncbi:MAG: GNAT family N-acetyltransferase [Acidimicrobiales bacterium]